MLRTSSRLRRGRGEHRRPGHPRQVQLGGDVVSNTRRDDGVPVGEAAAEGPHPVLPLGGREPFQRTAGLRNQGRLRVGAFVREDP